MHLLFLLAACSSGDSAAPKDSDLPGDDTGTPDTADTSGETAAETGDTVEETAAETGDTDTAGETGETGETGDSDSGGEAEVPDGIDTTTPYTGDDSCVGAPADTPDPSCQVEQELSGVVLDFQTAEPAQDAELGYFYADVISETPDLGVTADADDGTYTASVPACTPYLLATRTSDGNYVETGTFHVVDAYGETDQTAYALSQSTARIVPALLGISWDDATTGIAIGWAMDCAGDPLGYTQINLHTADGTPAPPGVLYYFDDSSFPADHATAPYIHPSNGMWIAIGLPDGDWVAEVWGYDGSGYTQLGAAPFQMVSGVAMVVTVHAGHDDGVVYPESCLSAC